MPSAKSTSNQRYVTNTVSLRNLHSVILSPLSYPWTSCIRFTTVQVRFNSAIAKTGRDTLLKSITGLDHSHRMIHYSLNSTDSGRQLMDPVLDSLPHNILQQKLAVDDGVVDIGCGASRLVFYKMWRCNGKNDMSYYLFIKHIMPLFFLLFCNIHLGS